MRSTREKELGEEHREGSSDPNTSAPARMGSDRRKDGSMSSNREKELDREFLHGDEASLEDALIEQQSTGWYFGPGGPGGHSDEVD